MACPRCLTVAVCSRRARIEQCDGWRDLQDLGVTDLMLLSWAASNDSGWPESLELELGFSQVLERLLLDKPMDSFGSASEVLKALESVALPAKEENPELTVPSRTRRALARKQGAKGAAGLW